MNSGKYLYKDNIKTDKKPVINKKVKFFLIFNFKKFYFLVLFNFECVN